jgi:molecular chaperone DnaK
LNDIDILGIDLGTTYSAIAVWRLDGNRAEVLANKERATLTPSAAYYPPDGAAPIIGRAALDHIVEQPGAVVYSVKRFMGRTGRDAGVAMDRENATFSVQEEPDRNRLVLKVGNRRLTPPEVSAAILTKLKDDAAVVLGRPVRRAVITVPAYFEEPQRQATREAGKIAGLEVARIVSEPTAAALAFGLGTRPQTVVVYDLGGGTFDFSVLTIDDGLFRVRGTSGSTHLGGDDIDRALTRWLADQFERGQGFTLDAADGHARARLRRAASAAKIALSTQDEHVVLLPAFANSRDLEIRLDRELLDRLSQPYIQQTVRICEELLTELERDKALKRANISQALLVGGQTRAPVVRETVAAQFGWTLNTQVNPDEAVAQGAAVLGARLCGHLTDRFRLWDVTPLTIGVELADKGLFEPIIGKNSQIPVERWRRDFTTNHARQEQIHLRIFQGERLRARDNTLIGEVVLGLGGPREVGAAHVACLFRVDQDGILHVRAQDEDADGGAVEVSFDRTYQLSRAEIAQHEQEAPAHAAEDALTRQLLELSGRLRQAEAATLASSDVLAQVQVAIDNRDLGLATELFANITPAD